MSNWARTILWDPEYVFWKFSSKNMFLIIEEIAPYLYHKFTYNPSGFIFSLLWFILIMRASNGGVWAALKNQRTLSSLLLLVRMIAIFPQFPTHHNVVTRTQWTDHSFRSQNAYASIPAPLRRGIDDYINIWECVHWDMVAVRDSRSLSLPLAQMHIIPSPSTHYVPNRPRHLRKSKRISHRIQDRGSYLVTCPNDCWVLLRCWTWDGSQMYHTG